MINMEKFTKRWNPLDMIVVIITIFVCVSVGLGVAHAMWRTTPMDDARAKLVTGVITSLVAIINMYVGAKLQQSKDREQIEKMEQKLEAMEKKP